MNTDCHGSGASGCRSRSVTFGWCFLEGESESDGENRKEGGVLQVVVVACDECGETFLEVCVAVDRLAADCRRLGGIAGAAGEGDGESGLAVVEEAGFNRNAEVAACSGDDVSESEGESGRDFAKADGAAAVECFKSMERANRVNDTEVY